MHQNQQAKQREATKADATGRIIERFHLVGEEEHYTYYSPVLVKHKTAQEEAAALTETFGPRFTYRAILK